MKKSIQNIDVRMLQNINKWIKVSIILGWFECENRFNEMCIIKLIMESRTYDFYSVFLIHAVYIHHVNLMTEEQIV